MADFTSSAWSVYIAVVTIVSILFCLWLALSMGKARHTAGKAGTTTGHVWDGLQEYNNPLPRWWLGLFVLTCVFAFVYLLLYPGLGAFQGLLNWTQVNQYERERARVDEVVAPLFAKYSALDIPAVAADPAAREMGERLYLTYCVQCHGSDARGSRGFPNLSDNDWLWGGDPEQIKTTIRDGRTGMMPPMAGAVGGADDVQNLANYVLSLSGGGADSTRAALGRDKFAACAACHGPEGKGNPTMGAPNLTDRVWLHGGGLNAIVDAINKGRTNQMPAFGPMLGEGKLHVLAAYIWSLSNRPAAEPAR